MLLFLALHWLHRHFDTWIHPVHSHPKSYVLDPRIVLPHTRAVHPVADGLGVIVPITLLLVPVDRQGQPERYSASLLPCATMHCDHREGRHMILVGAGLRGREGVDLSVPASHSRTQRRAWRTGDHEEELHSLTVNLAGDTGYSRIAKSFGQSEKSLPCRRS